jgi:Autoinducer binding domain
MQRMTIDSAAIRLTETILGEERPDLEQTLMALAANIGVQHIAYAPLCSQKSEDANLFRAICTYPVEWQARYFKKQYARIDPVIARGREAVLPFDWNELSRDDPALKHFLTTRLITMWVTMGCRSPFETARVSVLWFPSRAIIRRTIGPSINREI